MSLRRSSTLLAAFLGSAVIATALARPLTGTPTDRASSVERREIERIQAHFDSVLSELDGAGVLPAHVRTSDAAARRRELIAVLRGYRDGGVFPHNYDFAGQAVPYFIDRKTGTRCAVAFLLESTGRRDIVDRVARTDNNVWVAELAPDTAFTSWLDVHGLTLAEAARIQLPYVMLDEPPAQALSRGDATLRVAAPIALGAAAFTGMVNSLGNADGHRRLSRVMGFTSGAMAVGFGSALMTRPNLSRSVGLASVAVGGASIALASRATRRQHSIVARQREEEKARRAIQATLTPVVEGSGRGGLELSIRY